MSKFTLMWTYRSNEIRRRLMILAVHSMTSEAIQNLQNSLPNQSTNDVVKSFTIAKGITKDATSRSDNAKDTKNRFESLRRLASVRTAMQTRRFPKMAMVTNTDIKIPSTTFFTISGSAGVEDVSIFQKIALRILMYVTKKSEFIVLSCLFDYIFHICKGVWRKQSIVVHVFWILTQICYIKKLKASIFLCSVLQ